MNLDELKPLWEAYKEQTNQQSCWSETEIARILEGNRSTYPWMLNICMTIFIIGLTGC